MGRLKRVLFSLGALSLGWHPLFHIFGLPGYVDDATAWMGWLTMMGLSIEGVLLLMGAIAFALMAVSDWWWPYLTSARRLKGIVELIDEIVQHENTKDYRDMKIVELTIKLNRLQVPHPDLSQPYSLICGLFFLVLRARVTFGDIKAARNVYKEVINHLSNRGEPIT